MQRLDIGDLDLGSVRLQECAVQHACSTHVHCGVDSGCTPHAWIWAINCCMSGQLEARKYVVHMRFLDASGLAKSVGTWICNCKLRLAKVGHADSFETLFTCTCMYSVCCRSVVS